MKTITDSVIKTLVLAFILVTVLTVKYIDAAWSAPTLNPPGNNPDAPLNISDTYQYKPADLGALGIRAGDYCNAADSECVTITGGSYFFGGMYTTFEGSNVAPNPITNAFNCPTGYTVTTFEVGNTDINYCYGR